MSDESPISASSVLENIKEATTDLIKYYSAMLGALLKGDDTAAGKTDDKTPEKPGQAQVVMSLETDARKIANTVFSRGVPVIPADALSFSDIYDASQSCTRIAKLYSMTRKDFYNQAAKDKKVRDKRLALKGVMAERLIKAVDKGRDKVFV